MTSPESQYDVAIDDHAIARMTIPGYVDFLAADKEAVWATNEDRVEKLQADQSTPVATIQMPGPCGVMVVAFGSLWVASCKELSVYRLDVDSGEIVARIPTGLAAPDGELSLAAGAGSIWVLSDARGVLSRIDPERNDVMAEISVLPNSYCAAFGDNAVWITNSGPPDNTSEGSVQRIDLTSNQVTATIPVGPVPRFLAAGDGAVWTLNWGDGSVTKIDSSTNQAVATIALGMEGGGGDIDSGGGRVWIRGTKVLLASLDPATNEVTTIYGPPAGSGAVRVAGEVVWVTAHDTKMVWALRPDSHATMQSGGGAQTEK